MMKGEQTNTQIFERNIFKIPNRPDNRDDRFKEISKGLLEDIQNQKIKNEEKKLEKEKLIKES